MRPRIPLLVAFSVVVACRNEAAPFDARPPASATGARCDEPISDLAGTRGAFIGTRFGPLLLHERAADGAEVALSTDDLRHPCDASAPRLLVVRLDAPWCGTCAASADRFAAVLTAFEGQVTALDVVFSGADNGPARPPDAAAWSAAHPALPRVVRAHDATAAALLRFQHMAPAVFLVEMRSMQILDLLANPTAEVVDSRIRRALSKAGGASPAAAPASPAPLVDGRFTQEDWTLLQGMRLGEPPPDPSNAHAADPAAATLGKALFSDESLGGGKKFACATCHVASRGFADGRAVARGSGEGALNTLGLGAAAYHRWSFWDGRADSLWAQATSPIENPNEMAGSRVGVLRRLSARYAAAYEHVFGPLPRASDLPSSGKPGDASFDRLAPAEREAVTRAFVNATKALAAYERTLRPRASRFDRYLAGEVTALSDRERDGISVFIRGGCAVCHHGPALTDGAFHALRMPGSAPHGPPAEGRIGGVRVLLASEFRGDGPYSDSPATARLADLVPVEGMLGQMKTPSLRDISRTGPWGHGGTFTSLRSVIGHYDIDELLAAGPDRNGELDPAVVSFDPPGAELDALLAFLDALSGG